MSSTFTVFKLIDSKIKIIDHSGSVRWNACWTHNSSRIDVDIIIKRWSAAKKLVSFVTIQLHWVADFSSYKYNYNTKRFS